LHREIDRVGCVGRPLRGRAQQTRRVASPDDAGGSGPATPARGVSVRLLALAAALALLLLAAGGYAWRSGFAPHFLAASVDDKLANAPKLSIVVLPFENLSGDKEQDYFADGITDDLTTDLSHLDGSFVISRGTAFTYKGKPATSAKRRHRTVAGEPRRTWQSFLRRTAGAGRRFMQKSSSLR
jgi:adenylate cyclase